MEHGRRIGFLCFFGLLLALVGLVVVLILPAVLTVFIHEKMALLPDNPGYPLWRDLDIPIYQNFYFFNVTNPREVESDGAKPILKEIGPFVYRLNISKSELKYKQDQSRLTFRETKHFFFDRSKSSHDLNITLTTLNTPLVGVYSFIFKMTNQFYRDLALFALKKLKPSFFFEATVEELIFKGKKNAISCLTHLLSPQMQPDCYFSYFRDQNNSNDGLYEIFTGKDQIEKVNSIYELNGSDKLDFWDGDQCNRISGASNGELFPPLDVVPGTTNKTFQFFRTDFCRVFNITLNETNVESQVGGLIVDRFRPVADLFANATQNPKNSCYRPKPKSVPNSKFSFRQLIDLLKREGLSYNLIGDLLSFDHTDVPKSPNNNVKSNLSFAEQRPSGVFDLSACHQGAPVFISYPHFLGADSIYLRDILGLKPNLSLHETFLNIEPKTGTPVDFLARIQINLDVDTSESAYPRMRPIVFPVLWQEFSIHITDKIASTIKFETQTVHMAILSVALLVLVIGSVITLYGGSLIFMHFHRRKLENKQLESNNNNNDDDPLLDNQDTNNNSIIH